MVFQEFSKNILMHCYYSILLLSLSGISPVIFTLTCNDSEFGILSFG